jgi:DNA invertase Pin-like site-specific DNA recombinase
MKVGYVRTSTRDQEAGYEAQLRDLTEAGAEKIFQEQVSSVDTCRPQLAAALDFLRQGDELIVTKMDRFVRSVADLVETERLIDQKGATLRILALGIDTKTPTGRLILNQLAGIAQFEREIMLERQLEGIAKAKREGKYKGRKPTARAKADDVRRLRAEGKGASAIARELSIGRQSVYRILGV